MQPVNDDNPDQTDGEEEYVSKTTLKKEMHSRQKLGEELIALTSKQLDTLPLPEELRIAIDAAQKMTKHRALYRQRQYIGKVMRRHDPQPIQAALDQMRHPERQANARFHKVEGWRDRLAVAPDQTTDFIAQFPTVDRQQLGQKVRAASKERSTGKPVGAARALFRFIDEHLASLDTD